MTIDNLDKEDPRQPGFPVPGPFGGVPDDPQYKKIRKKFAKLQSALTLAAMVTDDETDDLAVELFNKIVNENFDEAYLILRKK